MTSRPFRVGGWTGIAVYVAVYDTWALKTGRETLSSAFARTVRHPLRRWPTVVGYTIVTLHLFDRLPAWLDPLHQYGRVVSRTRRVYAQVDSNLTMVVDGPAA